MKTFDNADYQRRLANVIRIGTVSAVDTTQGRCRVKTGELETDWLHWLTSSAGHIKMWSAPSIGEQVLILSISGELTTAFVLPAIFSDANPAPSASEAAILLCFPDGAQCHYEPKTGHLAVTGIKTATITAATAITLDSPVVTCTQQLITDSLQVNRGGTLRGDLTHGGGNLISNGITLHRHQHPGVQGGGDQTGAPT
ncbi:phage baseplate assembly protein V [Candidatus Regiella insecticola]|uniref:Baseplate assembly protein V (GpV) n=1 Tax=Candidatus Regiella insecticola TaxID=138073 RepID=A0A6L2ZPM3_9ENTR|nr:phage baseplate assembly protein V [Candidatus Regiella insecticola]GFN46479.1 baseplate assembly protein V (GpV) [Candidatus Regiella insecticola]